MPSAVGQQVKKYITNAADSRLWQNPGTLPDMNEAMLEYFQPMIFTQIVKSVVNFVNVETITDIQFQGVMQPFTDQKLFMKPEGQRQWKWFQLHSEAGLTLNPDDIVTYQGTQFRVMEKRDYTKFGYCEYHLVQDYTGSGGPNG